MYSIIFQKALGAEEFTEMMIPSIYLERNPASLALTSPPTDRQRQISFISIWQLTVSNL